MRLSKNAKLIEDVITHNLTFGVPKMLGMYRLTSASIKAKGKMKVEVLKGRQDILDEYGFSYEGMQGYVIGSKKEEDGTFRKLVVIPVNGTWCATPSFPSESLKLIGRV